MIDNDKDNDPEHQPFLNNLDILNTNQNTQMELNPTAKRNVASSKSNLSNFRRSTNNFKSRKTDKEEIN